MNPIYINNQPQKKSDETFRCKDCNTIIVASAHLCDRCQAERHKKTMQFLKDYWLILLVSFVIVGVVVLATLLSKQ
jgi:uncharacterized paraquat-inducible protein A